MSLNNDLSQLYRRDLTRLIQELQAFPSDELLWQKFAGVSNSAGTLTLHLEGNLSEYIGRQLGNFDYTRRRELEFSTTGVSIAELTPRIAILQERIPSVIGALTPAQLEAPYPERIFDLVLSVQQFLVHLYGHLNYHLGQIDYLRRVLTEGSAVKFASL